jgi:SET domain-containing protein
MTKTSAPRWHTRQSSIHGKGVFCLRPIAQGAIIGTYKGRTLTPEQANELYGDENGHTFLFLRGDGLIIDGGQEGNGTRFLNHGCAPNVEAIDEGKRIVLLAKQDIFPGQELLLDYCLQAEGADAEAHYPCRCGSAQCRGTMVWRERCLSPDSANG